MIREELEHLVSTGIMEGNSRKKQRETMLNGLTKWLKVGIVSAMMA